jgi:hypothetical protein
VVASNVDNSMQEPYSKIDHTHCPEKGSPCGIDGKHRCCLCGEKSPNQPIEEKWKETLRKSWGTNALGEDDYGCDGADDNCCGNCGGWIADIDKFEYFIENLLEQERQRRGWKTHDCSEMLSTEIENAVDEEREIINSVIREKFNPDLADEILAIINK